MLTPLEISFHGLERSDAVETRAREKFARLEKRFDRITHGRVVIEVPRRRASAPKLFNVTIEIGVPGDDADLAGLLARLVREGHPIAAFAPAVSDLEELFLQVTALHDDVADRAARPSPKVAA